MHKPPCNLNDFVAQNMKLADDFYSGMPYFKMQTTLRLKKRKKKGKQEMSYKVGQGNFLVILYNFFRDTQITFTMCVDIPDRNANGVAYKLTVLFLSSKLNAVSQNPLITKMC